MSQESKTQQSNEAAPAGFSPVGFSRTQIVLHWAVAALVLFQFVNNEAIGDWWRESAGSGLPEPGPAFGHIIAGAAVLVLMIVRVAIRLRRGAPAQPDDYAPLLKHASHWAHVALYAVMFLIPMSGLAAIFVAPPAAEAHEILTSLLLALVALHVLGALYHLIVRRDGVFKRIFVSRQA
ncbi:MAG: cytochrome b/b6 domain-containing protein [Pseudomonadales bacterium]|nr:cytochrome b/b6 domain-containing protein [Pseudomonadales bacterium]